MKKLSSLSFLKTITAFIICLLISCNSDAQTPAPAIQWQHSYGGGNNDQFSRFTRTTDGGYIMIGYSNSANGDINNNHGNNDYWVAKISATGIIQWQRSYGGTGQDWGCQIIQTSDGGYVMHGLKSSTDGDVTCTTNYYWIVKLDNTGNILWQKCYPPLLSGGFPSLVETQDHGFAVAALGEFNFTGNHGGKDFLLLRLDSTGNYLWHQCYGGNNDEIPTNIIRSNNGSFVIIGTTKSNNGQVSGLHTTTSAPLAVDYWVIKVDSIGNLLWQKCYGGINDDYAESIYRTNDSGYIISGYSNSTNGDVVGNHGIYDYWVVKINSIGNIQWSKCYGGTNYDNGFSIKQSFDGGYIVAGSSNSIDGDITNFQGLSDYWIIKLNDTGGVVWQKNYGGSGNDGVFTFMDILQLPDSSYIVGGSSASIDGDVTGNHGGGDYWIVKLGPDPSVVVSPSPNDTVCAGTSVTFTATPTYPGSSPSYQWVKNGVNVGSNSNTYTYVPVNGDSVKCIFTSSIAGASPGIVSSNTVRMTVVSNVTPVVSISNNAVLNTVCAGTAVTFTAYTTYGGLTPIFQWKVNGVNVGVNNAVYTYTPSNGDVVTCQLTSSLGCTVPATVTSNAINMVVNPMVVPTINITATPGSSICSGGTVTFTANVTNGGISPTYQWKKNGVNVGFSSSSYSYTPNNGDVIKCVVHSNNPCAVPDSAVSNSVTISTNSSFLPTISISANPGVITCTGSSVTFTANINNGGTSPVYQWKVNGVVVGGNSNSYTYVPTNGDAVTCLLTSNLPCAVPATVTSNTLNMTVNVGVTPTINITSSTGSNSACTGALVTYTANISNGGTAPTYQWVVNGVNAGGNSSTLTYAPANGDSIKCILTSSTSCPGLNAVVSNVIIMNVSTSVLPAINIAANTGNFICAGTVVSFSATPANGGTNPTYQWTVNGANVGTGNSTFSYAPANGDVVGCMLTSNASCAMPSTVSSNNITMTASTTAVTPSISITPFPGATVCAGTGVTYTATIANGGATPVYQWKVNNMNVGNNSNVYTYFPNTGDNIQCILTSNAPCATPTTPSSNVVSMVVNSVVVPVININGVSNVTPGATETYTATSNVTGGVYQWQVNGVNVGTNSNFYSYVPVNGDVVSCVIVTPSVGCYLPNADTSNKINIHVTTRAGNIAGMQAVSVYPTPTKNILHIDHLQDEMKYRLMNMMGAVVSTGDLHTGDNILSLAEIPSAIYMLEFTNSTGQREVIRVVKE